MSRGGLDYTVRRTALTAVALAAIVLAISATSAALEGHADGGVVIDPTGKTVFDVSRTGFAWRDGIRPGQVVHLLTPAFAPGNWSIETLGPVGPLISRAAPIEDALRASVPFALVGLVAAALAVVFLRTNRTWVLPLASLSLIGSTVPLLLANDQAAAAALVLAMVVPAVWAVWRVRGRRLAAIALAVGSAIIVGSWWSSYTAGNLAADPPEQVRRIVSVGGMGLLFADRALQQRRFGRAKPMTLSRVVIDVLAIVAIGAVIGVVYFAAFPTPVIAIAIVLILLGAAPVRAYVGRRLELALMADLREQVGADAAEEERARLARELHDVPLQELSGVIRRLELLPNTAEETGSLLAIADELRALAVELRPPMLDDLGLGAALDYLAEQASGDGTRVEARIEDTTRPEPDRRPPPTVELAVYRIASEAVANALRHARAHEISIVALVARNSVRLEITDDGVGLRDLEARRATSKGHLGLTTMRRRAQAIGAELSIRGSSAGTNVVLTWQP